MSLEAADKKRYRWKNGKRQTNGQGHLSGVRNKSKSIPVTKGCGLIEILTP